MHTLLVLSLLRCRKTSDMDHTHTLTTDSSLLRDGRVSSYISLLLNTSISLSQQLYRPPLIWPLARLGQTVWRLPGCLPVSPTALTSTTTLSGTNRKIKCFRQLSISCSNFLLNTDFNTHTSRCCSGIILSTTWMTLQKPAWKMEATEWCSGVSYSKNNTQTHKQQHGKLCAWFGI